MEIRVSFTGTKTVRQTVEATVTVDSDAISQAMVEEYGNSLRDALSSADFELDGTDAQVTLRVDISDILDEQISNNELSDFAVTDADIDEDYGTDWWDIEDNQVI